MLLDDLLLLVLVDSLIGIDGERCEYNDDCGNESAQCQIDDQGAMNRRNSALFGLLNKQIPIQLRNKAAVQMDDFPLSRVLISAVADRQDMIREGRDPLHLPNIAGVFGKGVPMQDDRPILIDEIYVAVVFLAIALDQVYYGIHRQPDACSPYVVAFVVIDPVVDKDRQRVSVCQVWIDIDFIIRLHCSHPEVPYVPFFLRFDLFQYANLSAKCHATHSANNFSVENKQYDRLSDKIDDLEKNKDDTIESLQKMYEESWKKNQEMEKIKNAGERQTAIIERIKQLKEKEPDTYLKKRIKS